MRTSLLAILAAASIASAASAAEPVTLGLPHQGRLLGDRDVPVTGVLDVTFTLFRSRAGSDAVWEERRQVAFDDGFYSVVLGDPDTSGAPPLTQDLFDGPLYLEVRIGHEIVLEPRLSVGLVPFSARALRADSMKGGVIDGATITGGTIAGSRIDGAAISGGSLKDAAIQGGTIQGAALTGGTLRQTAIENAQITGGSLKDAALQGATITGGTLRDAAIDASTLALGGVPMSANVVSRDGDVMTGPLAAPSFESTRTDAPPLTVASRQMVANLNAELLGGLNAGEFWAKSEFAPGDYWAKSEFSPGNYWAKSELNPGDYVRLDAYLAEDHTNLVNNGSMENWFGAPMGGYIATPPNWWSQIGSWPASAVSGFSTGAGHASERSLAFADGDVTRRLGAYQTLLGSVDGLQGQRFTMSVHARRTSGVAQGQVCLTERADLTGGTCATLSGSSEWTRATLTHVLSAGAEKLSVVLYPTGAGADERATYEFDSVMVVQGARALSYRPSRADATASGLVGYFAGECPKGWQELTAARGRVVVGRPQNGTVLGTQGNALGDQAQRTITEVPAHTHTINGQTVTTSSDGSHSHTYWDQAARSCDGTAKGVDYTCGEPGFLTDLQRTSNAAGTHNHTVALPQLTTNSTGASAVDVTMPYVQLTACQAL